MAEIGGTLTGSRNSTARTRRRMKAGAGWLYAAVRADHEGVAATFAP